jgi:hypothetical protein
MLSHFPRFLFLTALALLLLAFPPAGALAQGEGNIRCGDMVSGIITSDNDRDTWLFDIGSGGAVVRINMIATSGDLDTYLELYAPNGNFLVADDDSGGELNSLIAAYPLVGEGRYRIVASSYEGEGEYNLSLNCSPLEATPVSYDQAFSGTIDDNHIFYLYRFEGSAGDIIGISMADAGADTLDSYIYLYDPDGSVLGYDDDSGGDLNSYLAAILLTNGTYYLVLTRFGEGGGDSFGDFEAVLSPEVAEGELHCGETVSGTLADFEDYVDYWTFDLTDNDTVTLSMQSPPGELDPYLVLYGAGFNELAADDDSGGGFNSLIENLPVSAGHYQIEALSLSGVGEYTLSLTCARGGGEAPSSPTPTPAPTSTPTPTPTLTPTPTPTEPPVQEYLLITLDDLYVADGEDPGGPGEIFLWTNIGRWVHGGWQGKRVGNVYPYPNNLWVEVDTGGTVTLNLPVYLVPWDEAPDHLNLSLIAMDNDQGPIWISKAIQGLIDVLEFPAEVTSAITNLIREILTWPGRQAAGLVTDLIDEVVGVTRVEVYNERGIKVDEIVLESIAVNLVVPDLVNNYLSEQLGLERVWDAASVASQYASYARVTAKVIDILAGGSDAPEPVGSSLAVMSKSDEGGNWGIAAGATRRTFSIENAGASGAGGRQERLGHVTIRRITAPPPSTSVRVYLRRLYIDDNRESGDPEIYVHTRVVDREDQRSEWLSLVFENSSVWERFIAEIGGFPIVRDQTVDLFFVGTKHRFPSEFSYPRFYDIDDETAFFPNWLLFESDNVGPMLYIEVGVYEDDGPGLLEDTTDWLGSCSLLFITSELVAPGDRTRYETCTSGDIRVGLEIVID